MNKKTIVENLLKRKNYKKAIKMLDSVLKNEPKSYWALENLRHCYFCLEDDRMALHVAKKVYKYYPKRVMSIWGYAMALDNLNDCLKAISVYKKILAKSISFLIDDAYIGTRSRAFGIKNDCRFRIALCFQYLHHYSMAKRWFRLYITEKQKGVPSDYTKKEAQGRIKAIRDCVESESNAKQIELLIKKDKWNLAIKFIKKELVKYPEDAWWLSQLSLSYYEKHQYKKSLAIARKAFRINPKEPLVVWHYAGALSMTNNELDAIGLYKKMIKRGAEKTGHIDTTEGVRWASSLLNDCCYRIGVCYLELERYTLAENWLKRHLNNRSSSVSSIYSLKEVKKEIALCQSRKQNKK